MASKIFGLQGLQFRNEKQIYALPKRRSNYSPLKKPQTKITIPQAVLNHSQFTSGSKDFMLSPHNISSQRAPSTKNGGEESVRVCDGPPEQINNINEGKQASAMIKVQATVLTSSDFGQLDLPMYQVE